MDESWKQELTSRATEAGFLDARIADARPDTAAATTYKAWIDAGYHAEMSYLERHLTQRTTGLDHVLPGAKSIIMFAAPYHASSPPAPPSNFPSSPHDGNVRIARYALGHDYHYVLKDRLQPVIDWLEQTIPGHQWRSTTDSAPVMERTYAAASGLGFIGKNGMLISWMNGSFTLLASIITTAPLTPDPPRPGTCGQCTRCLTACPTDAFIEPGLLDSHRCISYLTIEKKTELTPQEMHATGPWAFGCDICQEVCPYNKSPAPSRIPEFAPGTVTSPIEPAETFLAPQSNSQFEKRFNLSPIQRPGRRRIQRLIRFKQDQ